MLGELWETLQCAVLDLQPSKCQWLPLQSSTMLESAPIGGHVVPWVTEIQMTILWTVISAPDPAGAATRHRLQQAWEAWWANRSILRCWRAGFLARARLFNKCCVLGGDVGHGDGGDYVDRRAGKRCLPRH